MSEGNYSKALQENKLGLELIPDHPRSLNGNFFIYLGLENKQAAYESFRVTGPVTGNYTVQEIDSAYSASGIEGLLRFKIRKSKSAISKARSYALLGEKEKAIEWLEIAYNKHRLRPYELHSVGMANKNLHFNPRFIALRKKLGLQDY